VRIAPPVPEQIAIGDFVRFDVTVTNSGDGTARGIVIRDEYDRGLSHPEDRSNQFAIEYREMRDLPPGESETVPLTFRVTAGGKQCHRVTVNAEGADAVTASGCVTAHQPSLEVTVTGPRAHSVGERATFRAVVKNGGNIAATNIVVVARCDPALNPVETEAGYESLPDGAIQLRFERIEPGMQQTVTLVAACVAPANSACTTYTVSADGGVTAADEACVEIRPVGTPLGTPGAVAPNLRITISDNANPARSGQNMTLFVNVTNSGQQVARDVKLSVRLPQELTPVAGQIQPAGEVTIQGRDLSFTVVPELQPSGEKRYVIPVTVGRPGDVQVLAAVIASGLSDFVRAQSNVIKIIPQ
jgi:uncharacterized repeat protein (TIGR01451 family)